MRRYLKVEVVLLTAIVACVLGLVALFILHGGQRAAIPLQAKASEVAAQPPVLASDGQESAREVPDGGEDLVMPDLARVDALSGSREEVWKRFSEATDVAIQDATGPSEFPAIPYSPPLDLKWNYVTTSVTRIGNEEIRTACKNSVEFDKQLDALLVTLKQDESWFFVANRLPFPGGSASTELEYRKDRFYSKAAAGAEDSSQDAPSALSGFAVDTLKPSFPPGASLAVGMTWKEDDGRNSVIQHRIEGYSKVNGKLALRISSEGPIESWLNSIVPAVNTAALRKVKNATGSIRSISYIDPDSGLFFRKESVLSLVVNANTSETRAVFQLAGTEPRGETR